MAVTIELPWYDRRLSPNQRIYNKALIPVKRWARDFAYYNTLEQNPRRPKEEDLKIEMILHPPDRRKRDVDNVLASLKPYLDGVCLALEIDDSRLKQYSIRWGEPIRDGKIILNITEVDEEYKLMCSIENMIEALIDKAGYHQAMSDADDNCDEAWEALLEAKSDLINFIRQAIMARKENENERED